MSVKTRSAGKSDAALRLPDNTTKDISAEDSRESFMDIWDSAIMKKGDTGISGVLSYNSLLTLTSNTDLAHKYYVDQAISSGLSGVILADGSITFTGNQSFGGNFILDLENIYGTGGNLSIEVENRTLGYSDGTTFAANWGTQTNGFGVNSKLTSKWSYLKTSNLSADRTFELPNYDFAFPTSSPGTNTYLKWDGANYVWAAASGGSSTFSGLTDVNLTSLANGDLLKYDSGTSKWVNFVPSYITGNQTITLSGDVSGSGSTSITTTIGAGKVTNAMLAGSISNAKLSNSSLTINGTSISLGGSATVTAAAGTLTGTTLNAAVVTSSLTSVGTIGTGVWNGTVITGTYGGTGVNNGARTFTMAGNVTFTGAFNATFAVPQSTTWTLPNTANETLAGLGTAQTFTAVQTFANGTVSAPGIKFAAGGSNTGIYSGGTDTISFASGGVNKMTIGTSITLSASLSSTVTIDSGTRLSVGGVGCLTIGAAMNIGTFTRCLMQINGGSLGTQITDTYVQYANDIVAGNSAPHFRTENGDIQKIYSIGGWGTPTGTLTRTTYATYAGQTISASPTQSEVQAIDDHVKVLSERLASLISDLKTGHQLLKS